MQKISDALQWATQQLTNVSDVAKLDAEVLLAHALQVPRSYFYAWPARDLNAAEHHQFAELIQRKLQGEPVAYITGRREFWSLDFFVSPDTLIPRPETELLVEMALEKFATSEAVKIADLGTGCGAIALSLAHEKPTWEVYATDKMQNALSVAKANAARLNLSNVVFCEGTWCKALPLTQFDAIISNPPYIAKDDSEVNQDVIESEPHTALFSADQGLADLRQIIDEAKNYLKLNGYLMLEHGCQQAGAVRQLLANAGYAEIKLYKDLSGIDRVTIGRLSVSIAS